MKTAIDSLKNSRQGDACLLCGGKPDMIGVFIPDDPAAFGGLQGKTRLIRYCLCAKCKCKADAPELVEKVIHAEVAGGATHAE